MRWFDNRNYSRYVVWVDPIHIMTKCTYHFDKIFINFLFTVAIGLISQHIKDILNGGLKYNNGHGNSNGNGNGINGYSSNGFTSGGLSERISVSASGDVTSPRKRNPSESGGSRPHWSIVLFHLLLVWVDKKVHEPLVQFMKLTRLLWCTHFWVIRSLVFCC